MQRNPGSEEIFEKELAFTQHKLMMRAKRKDLKSATARRAYDTVISKHNSRVTSAKNKDVRIKKNLSKQNLRDRVFNYENYAGIPEVRGVGGGGAFFSNLMSPLTQS